MLKEFLCPGEFVYAVECTDGDADRNGDILYSLTSDEFSIDQTSGVITVRRPLQANQVGQLNH